MVMCIVYLFLGVQCELSVLFSTCCGVGEGEAWFGVRQLVEVMETHYVGCLKMALRLSLRHRKKYSGKNQNTKRISFRGQFY